MKPDVTSLGHRVEVVQSGEWWAITVPSLRGVFSQARHLDEVPAAAHRLDTPPNYVKKDFWV